MKNTRLMLALLAVLVLGAVAFNLRGLEWAEEEVNVGATGPARRNPWYAVELLLNGRGVPAESADGLTDLPPTDHVILWMARQPSAQGLGRLEGWVRAGGHLIAVLPTGTQRRAWQQARGEDEDTSAPEVEDGTDFVPEVEPEDGSEDGSEEDEDTADEGSPLVSGDADMVYIEDALLTLTEVGVLLVGPDVGNEADLIPPQGGEPLRVQGLPWVRLAHLGARQLWPAPLGEEDGTPVLPAVRVALDQGWITVLASSRPFNNENLAKADHAALIWSLVQRDGAPRGARLIVSDEPPSIWALLWTYAAPALVSAGALLILWLWATLPRFGPLLPDPSPHRRSLVEHVLATGALLWERGQAGVMLKSARRAALREATGSADLSGAPQGLALLEAVSAESGLSVDELRVALYGGGSEDPESFVHTVRALHALHHSRKNPNPEGAA